MKRILILALLLVPGFTFAQKLPPGFTCQDLIDIAEGKLSRSTDGGRTYVPIRKPQARDTFGAALLSYDTQLCYRLTRGEITADQFNALHDEKAHQVRGEREKTFVQQKQLEHQQQALQNQQRALQNQQAAIQTQQQAVELQRRSATIQALQAEAARQQAEAHHQDWMQQQQAQHQDYLRQQQIQQRQLEQIRQEQARPKTISCFGGGGAIYCN